MGPEWQFFMILSRVITLHTFPNKSDDSRLLGPCICGEIHILLVFNILHHVSCRFWTDVKLVEAKVQWSVQAARYCPFNVSCWCFHTWSWFCKNSRAEHIPNCPVCAANVLLFLNENSNNNNNSTDLLPWLWLRLHLLATLFLSENTSLWILEGY